MQLMMTGCPDLKTPETTGETLLEVNFRGITMADQKNFNRVLADLQPETSDLTFTNLFMWQSSYGLKVFYHEQLDFWFLLAHPQTWRNFYLPPIGDWSDSVKLKCALEFMVQYAHAKQFGFWMRRTPRGLTEALKKLEPKIEAKPDPNTADYLYRTEDLIHLSGRKLHGKKNHLNQFLRNYRWNYQAMTPEIAGECLELETGWFDLKERPEHPLSEEDQAMATILRNFGPLNLSGGVIRIDGQIQAIAVGERLNANTGVIHIEKGNIEFMGIYAAINQQFATHGMAETELLNREEDMGIEGLRKAKLSYHPIRLVEKFNLTIL